VDWRQMLFMMRNCSPITLAVLTTISEAQVLALSFLFINIHLDQFSSFGNLLLHRRVIYADKFFCWGVRKVSVGRDSQSLRYLKPCKDFY